PQSSDFLLDACFLAGALGTRSPSFLANSDEQVTRTPVAVWPVTVSLAIVGALLVGALLVADEGLDVVDEPSVLRLGADRDEVVLPEGDEFAVEGDGGLCGDVVGDAADDAPDGLSPVAAEADDIAVGDGLADERRAAQEP